MVPGNESLAKQAQSPDIRLVGFWENAMSAVRLAVTVVTTAIAASRHPVVRAGVQAVVNNPKTRETAINTTRNVAYNAGVLARHLLGRNKS